MKPQRSSWKKLPVVALVAAAGGLVLLQLWQAPSEAPVLETETVELTEAITHLPLELPPKTPMPEVHESGQSEGVTGHAEHLVDSPQDIAMAELNYEKQILDNIEHLEAAAAQARAEGYEQRAEIMEKRMVGLERRLAEFDLERAGG